MHIIQLTSSRLSGYGGVQSVVKNLSRGFVDAGIHVSELMIPSFDPNHAPRRRDTNDRCSLLFLQDKLLEIFSTDDVLVLSHNLHLSHAFGIADAVLESVQTANIPHISVVHDVGPNDNAASKILLNSICVTTSDFNRQKLRALVGLRTVHVIPPPVDCDRLTCVCNATPRYIAYPGRITPSKGAHIAVMLLGYLSRDIGKTTLVLSARGYECYGESQEYISELGRLASYFPDLDMKFHDDASGDIAQLYSSCQLTLTIPLQTEGFNLTALESLMCERPVVAAPTGGMNWLGKTKGCIAAENRNVIALAKGVSTIISDWDHWKALAVASKERLKKIHDLKVVTSHYMSLCSMARTKRRW